MAHPRLLSEFEKEQISAGLKKQEKMVSEAILGNTSPYCIWAINFYYSVCEHVLSTTFSSEKFINEFFEDQKKQWEILSPRQKGGKGPATFETSEEVDKLIVDLLDSQKIYILQVYHFRYGMDTDLIPPVLQTLLQKKKPLMSDRQKLLNFKQIVEAEAKKLIDRKGPKIIYQMEQEYEASIDKIRKLYPKMAPSPKLPLDSLSQIEKRFAEIIKAHWQDFIQIKTKNIYAKFNSNPFNQNILNQWGLLDAMPEETPEEINKKISHAKKLLRDYQNEINIIGRIENALGIDNPRFSVIKELVEQDPTYQVILCMDLGNQVLNLIVALEKPQAEENLSAMTKQVADMDAYSRYAFEKEDAALEQDQKRREQDIQIENARNEDSFLMHQQREAQKNKTADPLQMEKQRQVLLEEKRKIAEQQRDERYQAIELARQREDNRLLQESNDQREAKQKALEAEQQLESKKITLEQKRQEDPKAIKQQPVPNKPHHSIHPAEKVAHSVDLDKLPSKGRSNRPSRAKKGKDLLWLLRRAHLIAALAGGANGVLVGIAIGCMVGSAITFMTGGLAFPMILLCAKIGAVIGGASGAIYGTWHDVKVFGKGITKPSPVQVVREKENISPRPLPEEDDFELRRSSSYLDIHDLETGLLSPKTAAPEPPADIAPVQISLGHAQDVAQVPEDQTARITRSLPRN